MNRYVRRPRRAPTDEWFLVLVFFLLGPLAWPARWLWRYLKEELWG